MCDIYADIFPTYTLNVGSLRHSFRISDDLLVKVASWLGQSGWAGSVERWCSVEGFVMLMWFNSSLRFICPSGWCVIFITFVLFLKSPCRTYWYIKYLMGWLKLVMLKPFYSHIWMSVNKIRIYPDIRFSVLITWVEAGYNSQLVRPSELGAAAVVECYHVTHWSLGRWAPGDDECSGVGRGEIPRHPERQPVLASGHLF